ncbi:ethanolamine utilization protein EutJ [Parageobacillus thermoglucosidasius]|uniref:Ethanolamine utilization protein EutJ family protein n=1 Tax=Geobacillus sp. (strain Y4.1MC1) TaxID=581103 RepID=A0A7U4DKV5_GEOS0|nr:ethanolamine utilization protein EutJ [Parageobacillus thermoglucosidasius]MBY6269230.1 ethanolamine utilization protein EutJ [Parageobacillus thermoglucosidasius]MED4906565.1 ethanolamine utilization protein EutJ [Parageobacillus thermoglucosidasius]MED4915505.1 ethanolamine utilization protein EutJ [Parageobacillus thermoglucosidasius]MED4946683.1 ethanolamine utilization protein EutJ [Parageobacillus thermoglucosidasius]MED4984840.1 ethanolamine utilization protein EutJ [Parageobacillus 
MSADLIEVNNYINTFAKLIYEHQARQYHGKLKVGVDLGTANIVLSVLDEFGNPVAGSLYPASVVKDGLVVDYVGAVRIVKELKRQVEELIGETLTYAATAVPPGTVGGNMKAISNVVESAGMEVVRVVDEPTAAASVLNVTDGAVVDVGGGTTGISILKNGEVIYTADEPTGGTHMSLVLAGYYKISFEEAEKLKKDPNRQKEIFPIVVPVIEKMASIVKRHIEGHDIDKIFLVGGACCFAGFEKVFLKQIGIETIKPVHPLLVTPLGIGLFS